MFESKDLEYHKGKYYGLYRAYVYDNKDPKNLGRLKVCCPSVYGIENGEPLVSDWAYPKFPICGNGFGIQCIPPVKNPDGSNVLVWLEFEMGDKEKPVWSGGPISSGGLQSDVLGNHKDKVNGTTSACCFVFTTPKGHKIILNDETGVLEIKSTTGHDIKLGEALTITSAGGNKITFNDKAKTITVNRQSFPI